MAADLSFVVPCYNEEGNAALMYETLHKVFDPENIAIEVVMVNDGSKDNTKNVLRNLYKEHPHEGLKVVNFSRNFGKEAAILCGLRHTTGDCVCLIDGDLQQRPETALAMYRKLQENDDLDCVAAFQERRNEGKVLAFFKDCFYKLINKMCTVRFYPGASDFRVFRRKMADAILSIPETQRFTKGIFAWVGFDTEFMPYIPDERNSGTSKWSFKKLFRYAIDGIVSYTVSPLRIAYGLGIFSMIASFAALVVYLIRMLNGYAVTGTEHLIYVMIFFFGILFVLLGLVGEYISKITGEVTKRPVYIEKEVLGEEE